MTLPTATETKEQYKIKISDRCDSCGAQAYVIVTGVTGELMFCAHDYNKIMDDPKGYAAMMAFAFEVVDERDRLQEKHSIYNF